MKKKGGNFQSGRVVRRSYAYAYSPGGVACADCGSGASDTDAYGGSRLALYIVQYERLLAIVSRKLSLTKPCNVKEMKQILDKVRSANELPFRTIIRRKTFGEGKKKYCFT